MAYETFDLKCEGCGHTGKIPFLHCRKIKSAITPWAKRYRTSEYQLGQQNALIYLHVGNLPTMAGQPASFPVTRDLSFHSVQKNSGNWGQPRGYGSDFSLRSNSDKLLKLKSMLDCFEVALVTLPDGTVRAPTWGNGGLRAPATTLGSGEYNEEETTFCLGCDLRNGASADWRACPGGLPPWFLHDSI